jgi:hypothetical protein
VRLGTDGTMMSSSSSSSSSSVIRGLIMPAAVRLPANDPGYRNMSQHPVCLFFTSGDLQPVIMS